MSIGRSALLATLLLSYALVSSATDSANPAVVDRSHGRPAAGQPDPDDVRELVRLLGDERVVTWLRERASAEPAGDVREDGIGAGLGENLREVLKRVETRVSQISAAWAAIPDMRGSLERAWNAEMTTEKTLRSIIYVIVFLFVGAGIEWLFWQYATGTMLRLEYSPPAGLARSVARGLIRGALMLGGIGLFALGSVGTFLIFDWTPFVEQMVLSLLLAVIALRAVGVFTNFVLAPRAETLRLVPIDDDRARLSSRWIMAIAAAGAVGFLIADTVSRLAVLPAAAFAVEALTGAVLALVLIAAVWHLIGVHRRVGRTEGDAGESDGGQRRLGPRNAVPVLWSSAIVLVFVLWLVGMKHVAWSVAIIAAFVPASRLVASMIGGMFNRAELDAQRSATAGVNPGITGADPEEDEEAGEEGGQRTGDAPPQRARGRYEIYRPIAVRQSRLILLVVAIICVGLAWEVDALSLSASPTVAGRLFGAAVDITVAILIADLIWVWARTAIDRRLADIEPPEPGHAPGPEARIATLLPLIRKVLLVTVIAMVVLIGLSSSGVNIGPILAGAGVFGIAIGFGAQALVRDIVSGVFFLIDDAFRVGEYIEIGDLRGVVESMSIRSLRIRHHRGAVHTVPFGELKSLTNYSRDWVIMKLQFRVPFDTDLKLVKNIVKKIGKELQENPEYGPHILETLKSQGVIRMEEFNMVIGVKFMAKPGEQWTIRRDAYQRIRDAFDAHGLSFAHRNVQVEVVGDVPNEEAKRAALAAAQDAIEQQVGVADAQPAKP